jgi:PKD repeat protein
LNTDPPVADFTANVTNIQIGGEVEFTDLSENTPTSWEWNFEGGIPATSTEQNPTVTYENTGLFDVSLTASNANGSDTKTEDNYIQVDTLTFIEENGNLISLSVFPNPVSDKLYIKLNKNYQTELSVTIFNLEGRMLFTQKLNNLENEIDMQNLEAGIYILKVFDGKEFKVLKINKIG